MAKLTAEMRNFIEKERDPFTVFVGTCNKAGVPNISAKGTFITILDDETIAYADVYALKTFENARQNPNVTVAVINAKILQRLSVQRSGRGCRERPNIGRGKETKSPDKFRH